MLRRDVGVFVCSVPHHGQDVRADVVPSIAIATAITEQPVRIEVGHQVQVAGVFGISHPPVWEMFYDGDLLAGFVVRLVGVGHILPPGPLSAPPMVVE